MKTLSVALSDADNATISDASATVTILEPEPPQLSYVADSVAVAEGETTSLTVHLSRPSSEVVTVAYETIQGSAVAGEHYNFAEGKLTFAPNETQKSIEVTALTPNVFQPNNKTLSVALSDADNATISDASATVMILEPEPPQLSFVADSASVAEGDAVSFKVSLSRPLLEDVTGKLTITSATASVGKDYNFIDSDSFTFDAGNNDDQFVQVQTLTTGAYRVEKSLKASLSSSADNILIGGNSSEVVINTTNSKPLMQVNAGKSEIKEGESVTFTVSLSRPLLEDVTGKLSITSATALATEDYNFINSDSFTIAAGETSQTVEVETLTTGSYRVEKSLTASLSTSMLNIPIGDNNSATVTIDTTDSPKPELSFVADSVAVAEGEPINFTVRLSRPHSEAVTGKLNIISDSMEEDKDYQFVTVGEFTFAAGNIDDQTVQVQTLTTGSAPTYRVEKSLSASLSSSTPNIQPVDSNIVTVTIDTTDSPKPELIVENTEVNEGDKTDITVRLTRASSEAVTVSWVTEDGTAEWDVDYQLTYDNLHFEANKKETDHNIEVQTYDKGPYKPKKQFYIKLIPDVTLIDIEERTVTIDVTNSRPKFSFVESHVEVTEGEPFILEVGLSRPSSEMVDVYYEITDGLDLLESGTNANGSLKITPYDETQSITLVTTESDAYHSGKTLTVILFDADNADMGDNNNATVTVKFGAPDKPELKVTFDKTKTFSFSWDKSARAEYYKLFEKIDDETDFADLNIGHNPDSQKYDHIVPLYARVNAQYMLQSCNKGHVCSDESNYVYISQQLADMSGSIGDIVNPRSNGQKQNFGKKLSLSEDGKTLAVSASQDSTNATGVTNVTNDDDLDTIKAFNDDDTKEHSGAVYVFNLEDDKWKLKAFYQGQTCRQRG